MVKKVFIALIFIVLVGIGFYLSSKKEFDTLEWTYKIDTSETIEYLQEKNNILIATTSDKKHSYINILNKLNGNKLAKIELTPILYEPLISDRYLFVASKKHKDSLSGDLYVIDLNNGDLILKEQYTGNKWPFIIDGSSLFFVDISGELRNINFESKDTIWKILSDNSFMDSTKPSISNNRFFICNNNQILALDLKTSEILYNFKAESKILSCHFDNNTAIVSMNNEYIYAIDLLLSRVRWKYKFVSLYSEIFLETLNNQYLLILNSINFSSLANTKRAKVLSDTNDILYILDLNNGKTKWQKQYEKSLSHLPFSKVTSNSTILLQSINKKLGAYFLDNGLKQWEFFSSNNKPIQNYSLWYDKVFLVLNYRKLSYIYILRLDDGLLLGKFRIPMKNNMRFNPVVDDKNIYMVYKDNTIKAFKIPSLNKDK